MKGGIRKYEEGGGEGGKEKAANGKADENEKGLRWGTISGEGERKRKNGEGI